MEKPMYLMYLESLNGSEI